MSTSSVYTYAIHLVLFTGDVQEIRNHPFLNEQNCWDWVWLRVQDLQPGQEWLGYCMPIEEFRRRYPGLKIEGDRT